MSQRFTFLVLSSLFMTGCAHTQLAKNVQLQATTLADIQEQQVLDNIAMICANPGATPHFAVPTGGGTGVNRAATGTFGLSWNPTTLTGITAGGNGNQTNSRSWTLTPVNDPVRLGLMKAVYRRVTCTSPNHCDCNCHASDCKLRNYFSGDLSCHTPTGWFHVSDKSPGEDYCCIKAGEYCGTYVWVEKDYFECLSQVTLAILDIATATNERLALANGSPEKTVAIEQTFTRGDDQIKGSYNITLDKYLEWLEKEGISYENPPGNEENAKPALNRKDVIIPQFRPNGHLHGSNSALDQLILQQGSGVISP